MHNVKLNALLWFLKSTIKYQVGKKVISFLSRTFISTKSFTLWQLLCLKLFISLSMISVQQPTSVFYAFKKIFDFWEKNVQVIFKLVVIFCKFCCLSDSARTRKDCSNIWWIMFTTIPGKQHHTNNQFYISLGVGLHKRIKQDI